MAVAGEHGFSARRSGCPCHFLAVGGHEAPIGNAEGRDTLVDADDEGDPGQEAEGLTRETGRPKAGRYHR